MFSPFSLNSIVYSEPVYAWRVTRTWHTWTRNEDYCDINNFWSILNHSSANRDISLTCGPIFLASSLIFMHLQLFLPLTSSSMIMSQRRWAWWKSRMKTSCLQTSTWHVFVNLAARASQNTSQVLVHVDDADVFLVFLHHAYHLCKVVMKLRARGRNNARCINMSQPAWKIGQGVSAISILAVVLFRIDQRLLITTAVPISILGVSSSSSPLCVRWLWLYDNPRPEKRGGSFPAEWSRSSRCFCASKWDRIAPRFCLLQVGTAHMLVV